MFKELTTSGRDSLFLGLLQRNAIDIRPTLPHTFYQSDIFRTDMPKYSYFSAD
jgi:hypothetical protein